MSSRVVCQGATMDEHLKKLKMIQEVRLKRLTEEEINFWTRRKTPKRKTLVAIKTHAIAEQMPDSDQLAKAESQELPFVASTSDQAPISTVPYFTPSDIKPKKTGIKRKSQEDISEPKKIKNISSSQSVINVQLDQRITATIPSEQTDSLYNQGRVYGNESITLKSSNFHQNAGSDTYIPASERSTQRNSLHTHNDRNNNCANINSSQLENISQKPVPLKCLKKELVDGTAPALQTLETAEKRCDLFKKSSASVGEENSNAVPMMVIEDLFLRLDSYHFSPRVVANVTELSKRFSDAFKVMAEFDLKMNKIDLNAILSVTEKQKHISLLKQQCQNILASNHSIGFSTVFSQMVSSFGISFRWELVILLYCKIVLNFCKLNNIKNLRTFFEARNLVTFLLAASNYKNDMVFKVLNLNHKVFASLINSTLSATFLISSTFINVDLGELNQQSDGDWKDRNSMFKDGLFYSNELAYCKPTNKSAQVIPKNCGINEVNFQDVVKKDLSLPCGSMNSGSMQSMSQLRNDQLLKSLLDGANHTQCSNLYPSKPIPAQYQVVALPTPSPQNINIQQQKQQNCHLPSNNQYQGCQQVYPDEAHKGVHKKEYKNIIQQQNHMQAVNKSLPIVGHSLEPITGIKSQNDGTIQQPQLGYPHASIGVNQGRIQQHTLGYSHLSNQLQPQYPVKNQQPHSRYPPVPVKGSPSQPHNQSRPINHQQQLGYTQVPNNGVQPHNVNNHQSQSSYAKVPNRSLQSPNQVNNLQGVLGYSQVHNQGLQSQNHNFNQKPHENDLQIQNIGLQSQTQVCLQQSTQGYTHIPKKQLQSQNQGRQHYNRESPLLPNRDQQKNIIQHQQYNSHVTNNGPPSPYTGVSQHQQKQQSYSQASVTGPQAAQYNLFDQFNHQQLSPTAQKNPPLVQNVASVSPFTNSSFHGNGPKNQGIVNNSHPIALNDQSQYKSSAVSQSNFNEYFTPKNHSQQNQMNRPSTIPAQCMIQTSNVTPQMDSSVNFKIRLPLSSPRNDKPKLVDDKVMESAVKVESVIKMTPESIKIGKAVDLFPSPSKTISVIKPTPSVTISHHPADATHEIDFFQANRTLPVKPVGNGEGLCTTPASLPSMPLITKTSPPSTQVVNETLTDLQDIARLASGNGAVSANVERAIKTEPTASVDPIPLCATTSSMQEETSRVALSGTTGTPLVTTEAPIKTEVPDFLSLFGTCSRSNCSKPATMVCSGCMETNYCSTECQEADWSEQHASSCGNN